jgi:hypothetical protein
MAAPTFTSSTNMLSLVKAIDIRFEIRRVKSLKRFVLLSATQTSTAHVFPTTSGQARAKRLIRVHHVCHMCESRVETLSRKPSERRKGF